MPKNPPEGAARISPMLWYEDVAGALEWLGKAFDLKEQMRMPGPDGSVMHAEMRIADGVVMLGQASAERGTASPRQLPTVTASLYVFVDDVDAHCARARAAGAEIVDEPADQFWGDRIYTARDCEGQRWVFGQHVRDVAPEDMKPPGA